MVERRTGLKDDCAEGVSDDVSDNASTTKTEIWFQRRTHEL